MLAVVSSVAAVVHFSLCWVIFDQVCQGQIRPCRFLDLAFFLVVECKILLVEHLRVFPRVCLFVMFLWEKDIAICCTDLLFF